MPFCFVAKSGPSKPCLYVDPSHVAAVYSQFSLPLLCPKALTVCAAHLALSMCSCTLRGGVLLDLISFARLGTP